MANVGEKVTSWLVDAVKDVTTLQVETYKCNITANVATAGPTSLKDFIDDLKLEVDATDNSCKVIMVTHGKVDHDTMVMYSNEMSADDERFVVHHKEIYEAAAKARSEVVSLAVKFARDAVVPD